MTEPQVPKEAAKNREEIKAQGTGKAAEPKKKDDTKDEKNKKKKRGEK
jgi:hypothetical protein